MNSIIEGDETGVCFLCGATRGIELHHCFHGAYRKTADKYGLTLHLCHACHNEPPNGVHCNRNVELIVKRLAERAALEYYGWSVGQFREHFGKNYLEVAE